MSRGLLDHARAGTRVCHVAGDPQGPLAQPGRPRAHFPLGPRADRDGGSGPEETLRDRAADPLRGARHQRDPPLQRLPHTALIRRIPRIRDLAAVGRRLRATEALPGLRPRGASTGSLVPLGGFSMTPVCRGKAPSALRRASGRFIREHDDGENTTEKMRWPAPPQQTRAGRGTSRTRPIHARAAACERDHRFRGRTRQAKPWPTNVSVPCGRAPWASWNSYIGPRCYSRAAISPRQHSIRRRRSILGGKQ